MTSDQNAADQPCPLERIEELEAVLRLFVEYSSDPWVREQAQELLGP